MALWEGEGLGNVTIIIPIYNDFSAISKCIDSLKRYVDRKHKIMLVNDMGPEWDRLERGILDSIKGYDHFLYKSNECNIGFVKTCNKAALEWEEGENDILLLNADTEVTEGFLEEMERILHMDEETGVVCPRSNNATFLSIPLNSNGEEVSAENSYCIFEKIKTWLPEREECWTGVGFAFLIKRKIIQEIGLFDEAFGRGYNEENDFCMRMRRHGYRVMKANYAYVYHMGRVSFQNAAEELELKNSSVLLGRYPDYWDKVKEFQEKADVIDYYADILTDVIYKKKRVLVALFGDMEKDALLDVVRRCESYSGLEWCDWKVVVNEKNERKIRWKLRKGRVYRQRELEGTFHVAYALSELDCEDLAFLDGHSVITKQIHSLEDIDVERDLEWQAGWEDVFVDDLRNRWMRRLMLLAEKRGSWKQGEDRNSCWKRVKKYLYVHHIWIFICWHRVRGWLG